MELLLIVLLIGALAWVVTGPMRGARPREPVPLDQPRPATRPHPSVRAPAEAPLPPDWDTLLLTDARTREACMRLIPLGREAIEELQAHYRRYQDADALPDVASAIEQARGGGRRAG